MNDSQLYEKQIVPMVVGFVKGAFKFGGSRDDIHDAVLEAFPRLHPSRVSQFVDSGQLAYRPLN